MSLMAQLASRQQLGYGQAVTSSEMAVTLGLAVGPMVATVPRVEDFWRFHELGMDYPLVN